jgi:hypothetical protein
MTRTDFNRNDFDQRERYPYPKAEPPRRYPQPVEKPQPNNPPALPRKSAIFMLIAAMLVVARVTIYGVVEQWGRRMQDLGAALTWGTGVAILLILLIWTIYECQHYGWLVVPGLIFLASSLLICASIYDPVLLDTGVPGKVTHPLWAAFGLTLTFLIAATPFLFRAMGFCLLLVTDPGRFIKK